MPRLRGADGGKAGQAGVLGQRQAHRDKGCARRRLSAMWGEGGQGRHWTVDCSALRGLEALEKGTDDKRSCDQVLCKGFLRERFS